MNRLIDANELIEIVECGENLIELQKEELIECVNACDTAYDVDKVAKQLEEFREEAEQFHVSGMLSDIIEVVKGGGVDAETDS